MIGCDDVLRYHYPPTYLPTYTYIQYVPRHLPTYPPAYLDNYLHIHLHAYRPSYLPTHLHAYLRCTILYLHRLYHVALWAYILQNSTPILLCIVENDDDFSEG